MHVNNSSTNKVALNKRLIVGDIDILSRALSNHYVSFLFKAVNWNVEWCQSERWCVVEDTLVIV